jgi:hypothetical protein
MSFDFDWKDDDRRAAEKHSLTPVRPFVIREGVKCKQCGGVKFERVPRYGFWQETVLPFFELYPWRCAACSKVTYRTQRSGDSPRR